MALHDVTFLWGAGFGNRIVLTLKAWANTICEESLVADTHMLGPMQISRLRNETSDIDSIQRL